MFEDSVKLSLSDWCGIDRKTGSEMKLSPVDVIMGGFECDSISACNENANDNRHCIEKGTDKTGSTAVALLKYIKDFRPAIAIMENVKAIKGPNLSQVVKVLNKDGYYVWNPVLRSQDYGASMRRERQYMIGIKTSNEAINQFDLDFTVAPWIHRMNIVLLSMRIGQGSLKDVLLDESDPRLELFQEIDRSTSKRSKKDDAVWMIDHQTMFMDENAEWPVKIDKGASDRFLQNTSNFPRRMQEVCYYYEYLKAPRECPAGSMSTHDINMSLTWGSTACDILVCIITSSVIWLTKRQRVLRGWEALRAQGFPAHLVKHDALTENKFIELAGNAFSGFVLTPLFISILSHMNWKVVADLKLAKVISDAMEEQVLNGAGEEQTDGDTELEVSDESSDGGVDSD